MAGLVPYKDFADVLTFSNVKSLPLVFDFMEFYSGDEHVSLLDGGIEGAPVKFPTLAGMGAMLMDVPAIKRLPGAQRIRGFLEKKFSIEPQRMALNLDPDVIGAIGKYSMRSTLLPMWKKKMVMDIFSSRDADGSTALHKTFFFDFKEHSRGFAIVSRPNEKILRVLSENLEYLFESKDIKKLMLLKNNAGETSIKSIYLKAVHALNRLGEEGDKQRCLGGLASLFGHLSDRERGEIYLNMSESEKGFYDLNIRKIFMPSAKEKGQRALKKLSKVGRGLKTMREEGLRGRMLSSSEGNWLESARNGNFTIEETISFLKWSESGTSLSFDEYSKAQKVQSRHMWSHTEEAVTADQIRALDKENAQRKILDNKAPEIRDWHLGAVPYLNADQRKGYEVSFQKLNGEEDARLFRNRGVLETTGRDHIESGEQWHAFVISPEWEMYAGEHQPSEFHHSSFMSGGGALGAGMIKTDKNGKVREVTTRSGHYQPREEQILNELLFLQANGVDLSTVVFHHIFGEVERYENSLIFLEELKKKYPHNLGPIEFSLAKHNIGNHQNFSAGEGANKINN